MDNIKSDTIFTVLVTISIFIIGQIVLIFYDRYKDKKSLSNLKKFFLISVKDILNPLAKELGDIKDIITQIEEKKQKSYFLQDATELNFDFYNKTDNSTLFNAFTKYIKKSEENNTINAYTNLIKSITSFRNFKNDKLNNYNIFINTLNKYNDVFKENFKTMMYNFDDIQSKLITSNNTNQDEFVKRVFDIIRLANDLAGEMYYQVEKVIDPIISTFKAFGNSPYAKFIIRNALTCKSAFTNICFWKDVNIKKYKRQVELLEKLNTVISQSINYLEK